jgi:hypothetical protein
LALSASFLVFQGFTQEIKIRVQSNQVTPWWNNNYAYEKPLNITNKENFSTIGQNQIIKFSFNHQELVQQKKSKPDGNDVRLIYWDGQNFKNVDFWPEANWNQTNTTIKFKVPEKIPPGKTLTKVYLYYGNTVAEPIIKTSSITETWKAGYSIAPKEEVAYPLLLEVDRLWSIKTSDPQIPQTLSLSLRANQTYPDTPVTFKVLNTSIAGKMEQTDENLWEGIISLKNLTANTYQIQAELVDRENNHIKSQKCGFHLSQPLYVAWTIDWEGYDINDLYLNALANIAEQYGLKMTHFFNPRIYTNNSISPDRQDFLTNWVKLRKTNQGEEIGLHLHMFYDFILNAGLEPKKSPNWGDQGDGYGALTTNYNQEEMVKILDRAIGWFDEKGLGKPLSYRAGGWFANLDTLKALEEVGFRIDGSGRTPYHFGANKIPGPWNLLDTTQPYYPSILGQNQSSPDHLNLLEIPNNGADSYAFSAQEMINRFKDNWNNRSLQTVRQVTFLSHPDWFNKNEQDKIKKIFNYVDQFSYERDLGPVVYATLSDIEQDISSQGENGLE